MCGHSVVDPLGTLLEPSWESQGLFNPSIFRLSCYSAISIGQLKH